MRSKKMRLVVAAVAAGVLVASLSACATDSDSPSTTTGPSQGAAGDFPTLDELYESTSEEPPADGPTAAKEKSVWVITCGPACEDSRQSAEDAIDALGWDYNYADGNLNIAGGYSSAIRTALASDPDALFLNGFSCVLATAALQEAKDQGIPVISAEGVSCDATDGSPLFSVPNILDSDAVDNAEWWKNQGKRAAWYLIAQTGGKLKAITTRGADPLEIAIADGFKEEVDKCAECEISEEIFTPGTDLIPNGPWIQNFRAALIKHPDANGVYLPFDFMYQTLGGAAAVQEAGSDAILTGGAGLAETQPLVASGTLTIPAAWDNSFHIWATMDNLNRYFNDVPAAAQGVGFTTVNADNPDSMPAAGKAYTVPFDYEAVYKKVWTGQ
ncbi:sugar ABC transporter substrate-binding protein [Microbacterium sp. 22303]|uniref:sugar ABC transporter substrate-binding protein n=1 Tax=Microbacterium sp. 22303 TaxID=3453905 RepID=UPI003F8403A2